MIASDQESFLRGTCIFPLFSNLLEASLVMHLISLMSCKVSNRRKLFQSVSVRLRPPESIVAKSFCDGVLCVLVLSLARSMSSCKVSPRREINVLAFKSFHLSRIVVSCPFVVSL